MPPLTISCCLFDQAGLGYLLVSFLSFSLSVCRIVSPWFRCRLALRNTASEISSLPLYSYFARRYSYSVVHIIRFGSSRELLIATRLPADDEQRCLAAKWRRLRGIRPHGTSTRVWHRHPAAFRRIHSQKNKRCSTMTTLTMVARMQPVETLRADGKLTLDAQDVQNLPMANSITGRQVLCHRPSCRHGRCWRCE